MSFTTEVKNELALLPIGDDAEQKAELSAFLLLLGSLNIRNNQWELAIRHENAKVIKRIYNLVKTTFNGEPELKAGKKDTFKKNSVFQLIINQRALEIMTDLGLYSPSEGLIETPPLRLFPHSHAQAAFLRAAFMSIGSINSPDTSNYHFELNTHSPKLAEFVIKALHKFDVDAKSSVRRGHSFVYIKKSDAITDALRVIQASKALMEFESTRIQRDQYVSMTRVINCEIANEVKAQEKAREQVMMIERLQRLVGLDELDAKIRQVAILRLENQDLSMQELAEAYQEAYGQAITKSGLIHRFEKIRQYLMQFEKEPN